TIDSDMSAEAGTPEGQPAETSTRGNSRFGAFRAFQHRNYRLYFGGQLTSLAGTWMQRAAFNGSISSLDMPSRQSFVVEMVGYEDLANAIALNSMMFNGARMIGPAI